ncbi:MAG: GAF domain-containing protein [Cyanobacteria bacterium P01_F01_bin.13]
MTVVLNKLCAQTAAVFLINKDGLLKRFGFIGYDKYGNLIDRDWFQEEAYPLDSSSFVGRASMPGENSKYGETQYASDLGDERLDGLGKVKYTEKCGYLKGAIAIPLNGRNKTYGVLRIINKLDSKTRLPATDFVFEKDDVVWLTLLSVYLANALSNYRRDVQTKILQYLNYMFAWPSTQGSDYYTKATRLLAKNPETAFQAAVLRLLEPKTKILKVVSTAFSSNVHGKRDDNPINFGEGLAGWVAANTERLILSKISLDDEIVKFRNKAWVQENRFEAFGCFPLFVRGKILGTLSLYTGYNYDFHADTTDFILSFTESLATFTFFNIFPYPEKLQRVFFEYQANKFDSNNDWKIAENAVINSLKNPKYDFRTVRGISEEANIPEEIVSRILSKSSQVRTAWVKGKLDEELYTHISKKVTLQEFLASSQRILSKSFR